MDKHFKRSRQIVRWCSQLSQIDRSKMEEAMRKMVEAQNKKMKEALPRSK